MEGELIFPDHGDPNFASKLSKLREYQMYKTPPMSNIKTKEAFEEQVVNSCFTFEKTLYQNLMAHYLSRRSPYRSLMLFHSLGTGKTCSAITIAESLLLDHTQKDTPKILVVASSVLQKSFEEQIFSYTQLMTMGDISKQCNGDLYMRLIHGNKDDIETVRKRIHNLIISRYKFLTYGDIVGYNKKNPKTTDKVIIVDEAHNLRISETEKKAADALEKMIENGARNRVVLLTATPMYNEPDEIFWLLSLLLRNDKISPMPFNIKSPPVFFKDNKVNAEVLKMIKQLASEYISYIKSANPFTFAVKLSPADSGIDIINESDITIVPTQLGKDQIIEKEKNPGLLQLELSNIKFANDLGGGKGFKSIFNVEETQNATDPFKVNYRNGYENYLAPDNLGNVAAKMKKICEFVATSEGIVVVYSQFAWSGVVPFAIALEHMGFQRYGGHNILVKKQNTIIQNTVYEDIPFPGYCILSTDPLIMGTGSSSAAIDKMVKVINAKNNIHGQKIKVILMTKVASEGLSFRNVREVHIMDPWYHMNRLDQVSGRAIRTCSHTDLPLEERNVTVFMHASGEADINAYRISARKFKQTQLIENAIRDSALDCNLLENINYYPKSIFEFDIVLRTSQKKLFLYNFGDDPSKKPNCTNILATNKTPISRSEIIEIVKPTLLKRMQKYINAHKDKSIYININDLIKYIGSHEEVAIETIYQGIYPNKLIENYMIYPHLGNLVIVPDLKKEEPVLLNLPISAAPVIVNPSSNDSNSRENNDAILDIIEVSEDKNINTISAYTVIDSDIWFDIAKKLITREEDRYKRIADIFGATGALIERKEIARLSRSKTKYIGFVNIFNIKDFEVILYDGDKYIKATDNELEQIKNKRTEITRTAYNVNKIYGILEPYKFSKNKDAPLRFTFKIIIPDIGKNGEICGSKRYTQLNDIMEKLNIPKTDQVKTKDQFCYTIMYNLAKTNKLYYYPSWRPS